MTAEALECARTIFDYLQLRHHPAPADVMVVFGTNDTRVADFAADLYRRGLSKTLVVTGGMAHQGDLLATNWTRPEAEIYADILYEEGVAPDDVMLECRATNTAENVRFSRELLEARGIKPRSLLLVSKPFMQRRVFATHAVVWPEVPATLASWTTTFDDYCNAELPPDKVTNIMMGDLQRVWIYAGRGWSAPQTITEPVQLAFHRLKELGYTKHLLPDD